jgi:protein arginine kinase
LKFDSSNPVVWLSGQGEETDIVLSTRLRLARNLQGFPFKGRITPEEENRLEAFLAPKVVDPRIGVNMLYAKLTDMDELERLLLLENHLISIEHFNAKGPRGVAFNPTGSVSIMVNEEDHLRMQVIASGLALEEEWNRINAIDDLLSESLTYSFNPSYGFLTSCPTNVGTGLRVSVMLHLPALVLSKHIEKVFNAVSQVSLAVRGFFGEGSQAIGDFYQISNQITLGMTPEEIIDSLSKVLPKIIEYEREVRRALRNDDRKVLDDKVWRAIGMLRAARSISSEETLTLLSSVRLGVNMNIFDDVPLETVNRLLLEVQPGHLQKIEGRTLKAEERDIIRANLLRSKLQEN